MSSSPISLSRLPTAERHLAKGPGPELGFVNVASRYADAAALLVGDDEDALREGRAVASSITNEGWQRHIPDLPAVTATGAGATLAAFERALLMKPSDAGALKGLARAKTLDQVEVGRERLRAPATAAEQGLGAAAPTEVATSIHPMARARATDEASSAAAYRYRSGRPVVPARNSATSAAAAVAKRAASTGGQPRSRAAMKPAQ